MKGPAWHVVASGNWASGWKWGNSPQRPPAGADRCVPRATLLAYAAVAPAGLLRGQSRGSPLEGGLQLTEKTA